MKDLDIIMGMDIDDLLVEYFCENCGEVFYFSPDSLPGGDEHCDFCEACSGNLSRSAE